MNKDEFLRQLEVLLSGISQEERTEALAFYRSYFEDAGEANEAKILEELESPQKVADSIIKDLGVQPGDACSSGAAASGQYDSREVADALAHARRMVRCAQLKVRNLREEEREQQSAQKENSGKSQQKEHEVKRRVAQKERQLKQKVAIENTQEVLRQKKKKNEMAQKQQRHRSQERGKIAEADFKYIKSQLEAGKGFGGGSSYCEDSGFTLDISDAAMSMAELEMMAQNQTEAEAEAEVEAEMSLTDGGTLAAATAGAVPAGTGAGTASDTAPAAAGASVDVSV